MIVILPKPGKSLFDVEEMVTSSGTKLYGLIGQFFSYKYVDFTKKNLEIETLTYIQELISRKSVSFSMKWQQ